MLPLGRTGRQLHSRSLRRGRLRSIRQGCRDWRRRDQFRRRGERPYHFRRRHRHHIRQRNLFRRRHLRLRAPDQLPGLRIVLWRPPPWSAAPSPASAPDASRRAPAAAKSRAASPAGCTTRSSFRWAVFPGRRSIAPAAPAPRSESPTPARPRAGSRTARRRAGFADVASRAMSVSSIPYTPGGFNPWPLVGARLFMRSIARCRGRYDARNWLKCLNRPASDRSRRISVRKSRSGTACAN